VEEVDPTGAGDCFGGAYLACRRLGMPVEQALTYGCAAGARNVTRRGPMEGAGTRAELDEFIQTTKRLA
jgi:sugar/nucleoside kinase (ribokinase family)